LGQYPSGHWKIQKSGDENKLNGKQTLRSSR
jgi:hypothetical protein